MPYIEQGRRAALIIYGEAPQTTGELTFLLARLVDTFLQRDGAAKFQDFGEAVAALECTKLELYRSLVGRYEDVKLIENGDVWTR